MQDSEKLNKIKDKLIEIYYEIMQKQIKPFPHNSLFHKVSDSELEDYWFPIISLVEQSFKIILENEIKLRYANNVYTIPSKADFIKKFKGEAK